MGLIYTRPEKMVPTTLAYSDKCRIDTKKRAKYEISGS